MPLQLPPICLIIVRVADSSQAVTQHLPFCLVGAVLSATAHLLRYMTLPPGNTTTSSVKAEEVRSSSMPSTSRLQVTAEVVSRFFNIN